VPCWWIDCSTANGTTEIYTLSLHDALPISRGGKRNLCEVWPISLRQRLPRVALPLAEGDPDVVLDLQVLFTRCYDAGGFGRRIDYSRRPAEPLLEADADWADDLLSERGLRA